MSRGDRSASLLLPLAMLLFGACSYAMTLSPNRVAITEGIPRPSVRLLAGRGHGGVPAGRGARDRAAATSGPGLSPLLPPLRLRRPRRHPGGVAAGDEPPRARHDALAGAGLRGAGLLRLRCRLRGAPPPAGEQADPAHLRHFVRERPLDAAGHGGGQKLVVVRRRHDRRRLGAARQCRDHGGLLLDQRLYRDARRHGLGRALFRRSAEPVDRRRRRAAFRRPLPGEPPSRALHCASSMATALTRRCRRRRRPRPRARPSPFPGRGRGLHPRARLPGRRAPAGSGRHGRRVHEARGARTRCSRPSPA